MFYVHVDSIIGVLSILYVCYVSLVEGNMPLVPYIELSLYMLTLCKTWNAKAYPTIKRLLIKKILLARYTRLHWKQVFKALLWNVR